MLKIKIVVLAMLPLMLSACGGGGSSGNDSGPKSDNNTTVPIQEKVTVDLYHVDPETLSAQKYAYVDNVIKGITYYTPLSEDEFLLTADQLFTNTWVDSDTKAITPLKFYFSDAPKTGYYHTFKKINISGENVFDRFYPGYKVIFDQWGTSGFEEQTVGQAYQRTVPLYFPQGSYCYQVQDEIVDKPYITFSKEGMTGDNYDEVLSLVEANFKAAVKEAGHTYKISTGKWNDYTWRYYREYDAYGVVFEAVLINFKGELVIGKMNHFEDTHLSNMITEQQKRLATLNKETDPYNYYNQKAYVSELEKGCSWYNDIAAQTIAKL
ncbi:hypothetical protein ACINWC323_0336 [Acinetobacter sp. WC-323]|uniref:hypothetical protein n=1 Tax=Acinetobacter sp. WC-323 TaxID=903918 RepID=UPI00029E7D30|nr:hypothetical protein [Acinetobacter sp. WC-323]EKU53127.1 hypothetical protein ACINWC323_0336 [Acinetobacter sp. WC-323]